MQARDFSNWKADDCSGREPAEIHEISRAEKSLTRMKSDEGLEDAESCYHRQKVKS